MWNLYNFALVIELERHIEILLLDNDCVIVPGLGGFMAHHVEARYDATDCNFLPPLRTLGFNPQLKLNDSLLAQSYVEAYDISYPEALRRIENEVNELRQHLDNEGRYELNDIGVLSVNDEGNMVFEPCESGILTPSLYGFSSFEMKRLDMDVESAPEKPVIKVEKVAETVQPAVAVAEKPVETAAETETAETKDADNDTDTIRIKVSWIRNAVAVAAAVIAFFLISTPVTNSTRSNYAVSDINSNFMTKLSPSNLTKGEVRMNSDGLHTTIKATSNVTVADTVKVVKTEKDTIATDNENSYCIVLASHVTRLGANDYIKRLDADGIEGASVYEHNKIVRVVYGSYKSEEEAQKNLRKLRDNEIFEQAWVYKKR